MLYETLLQGKIFLFTFYFGIVASLFFETKFLLLKPLKGNKIFNIIFEILAMIFSAFIFWYCILKYNYGIFRLYELVGFCLGIAAEYFSLHKLLEKNLNLIYNLTRKLFEKIKKIRFFRKIVK